MTKDVQEKSNYGAEKITVLKGLEAVRRRPAMYIGDVGKRGLHHLVYEVVDNSVDEALAGECTKIEVSLNKDGSVSVEDNGRGIPVDIHKEEKLPALEVVMTILHAGGKFDKGSYKVSGGLHGVGVSVVNALSELLTAEVHRNGKIHKQSYSRGKATGKLEVVGKTKKTGTIITFLPDHEVFNSTTFEFDIISDRLRELAYLNSGLEIKIVDDRDDEKVEECYQYAGGLIDFVKYLDRTNQPLHDKVITVNKTDTDVPVEVAILYISSNTENI